MNNNFNFDAQSLHNNNLDLPSSSSKTQPPPFDNYGNYHDGNWTSIVGVSRKEHYAASTPEQKKLSHKASERYRRAKINTLYSSLRSLLPCHYYDPMKQLGMPEILGGALKYIPEIQNEVSDLNNKKEELLAKISSLQSGVDNFLNQENTKKTKGKRRAMEVNNPPYSISINNLDNRETIIHLSTLKSIPLHQVLLQLEKYGLLLIDVSSSQSFQGRFFYNLHVLLEEGMSIMEQQVLVEHLESLIEKLFTSKRSVKWMK